MIKIRLCYFYIKKKNYKYIDINVNVPYLSVLCLNLILNHSFLTRINFLISEQKLIFVQRLIIKI